MDKPKTLPRKGKSKPAKIKRRSSSSSESHDVQELKPGDDTDENPDRDDERSRKVEGRDRPSSSKKGKHSRHQPEAPEPQPGTSGTSLARPSSPSGRRSRLKNRPREDTFSVEDDNDLHTSDFKRQLERLERDLTRRDRELEEEREENERCMDRIKKLERDKVELKREVEGLRDEAEDYKRTVDEYKDRIMKTRKLQGQQYAEEGELSEDDVANHNDTFQTTHEILVMQKNKEIQKFIQDIEVKLHLILESIYDT